MKKNRLYFLAVMLFLLLFSFSSLASPSNTLEFTEDENYSEEIVNAERPNFFVSMFRSRGVTRYRGSFNMTGGIYCRKTWRCSDNPTFDVTVNISSSQAPGDGDLYVSLQRYSFGIWDEVAYDTVSSMYGGSVSLTGSEKGKYRIYLRLEQASGYRVTGNVSVELTY